MANQDIFSSSNFHRFCEKNRLVEIYSPESIISHVVRNAIVAMVVELYTTNTLNFLPHPQTRALLKCYKSQILSQCT